MTTTGRQIGKGDKYSLLCHPIERIHPNHHILTHWATHRIQPYMHSPVISTNIKLLGKCKIYFITDANFQMNCSLYFLNIKFICYQKYTSIISLMYLKRGTTIWIWTIGIFHITYRMIPVVHLLTNSYVMVDNTQLITLPLLSAHHRWVNWKRNTRSRVIV